MLKDKGTVIDEMRGLISHLNCSDSHCEVCAFRSHCCMCTRALEVLYDNGYRNMLTLFNKLKQDMEREIDMRVLEELDYVRKETAREIFNVILSNTSEIKYDAVCEKLVYIEDIIKIAKQYGFDM